MLESFSYIGLFGVSFISATLYPLASEAFVVTFLLKGFSPVLVLLIATFGNSLGSLSSYMIARMGESFILEKYFSKTLKKLSAMNANFQKYGFIYAFLTFLPVVGDIFALGLGLAKYSFFKTAIFIILGKGFRYALLIYMTLYFQS